MSGGESFLSRKANRRVAAEGARRDSELFVYATIEALSDHIAVLDELGLPTALYNYVEG